MKRAIKTFVVSLLIWGQAILPLGAYAATYYVADCATVVGGTVADPACVAGDDTRTLAQAQNPATPWKTHTGVANNWGSIQPGDQILFARGGTWAGFWFHPTGLPAAASQTNPIAFDSYAPSWGAGTQRPYLQNGNTGQIVFSFNKSGNATQSGSYKLQHLDLSGGYDPHYGTVTSATTTTLTDTSANFETAAGGLVGQLVTIKAGTANQSHCTITANTATTITCGGWSGATPSVGDKYATVGAQYGVGTGNGVWGVTLLDLNIRGFEGGLNCSGFTNAVTSGDGSYKHYQVLNSTFSHNTGAGVLAACSDLLISGSTFRNNGANLGEHHIYFDDAVVAGVALDLYQLVIEHSRFEDAFVGAPGGCNAAAIVVHGSKVDVRIEDNVVIENTVPTSTNCWGISVDSGQYSGIYSAEGFRNVLIRGNTVVNYWLGIGCDIGIGCTIENNDIVTAVTSNGQTCASTRDKNFTPTATYSGTMASATSTTFTAATNVPGLNSASRVKITGGTGAGQLRTISGACSSATCTITSAWSTIPDGTSTYAISASSAIDADDLQVDKPTMRGNSCYIASPGSSAIGFQVASNAADALTGGGYSFHSNLVEFGGTPTATTLCFDTRNVLSVNGTPTPSKFSAYDGNLCHASAGSFKFDATAGTLAALQAAPYSLCASCSTADPGVAAPTGPLWRITPTNAPATNGGYTGDAGWTLGIGGVARPATRSIGAVQTVTPGGVVPSPATNVEVN